MKFLLTFLIVCFTITTQAQHKYDWSKYYNLPFKEDSATTFDNQFVQDNIVSSIRNSKADIEIRFYLPSIISVQSRIYVLSCYPDTILCTRYDYRYHAFYLRHDYENRGKAKSEKFKWAYVNRIVIPAKTTTGLSKQIEALKNSHFFILPDQTNLLDSLKKIGTKIIDPNEGSLDYNPKSLIYYEVKIGNKFRNFNTTDLDYYLSNANILPFYYNHQIINIIQNVIATTR